ncbi:unnamed protein product [Cladocopium goreaui]|uniref:Reverse transcriptase domain-containing protein n=1 Tax=Cladocopium goreaui TaxID=2562237 RepID=A0A9P1GK88_9DINO|nr:unnamed protein product [Cladocopium goreaui]
MEIRPEEGMAVLDRSVSFDCTQPVCANGAPLPLIHADTDAIWVESPELVPVGTVVSQLHSKGTDSELFQLFLDAWKQMWGRHQQVPYSRWHTILQFARDNLPFKRMSWPAIDVRNLRDCIAHKHSATSAGLDGVTLRDLRAMPDAALSNFVALFLHAEHTGGWPQQVIAGRVTCLPKKEHPVEVLDFRPITVLGLLYRCWGTIHARHAIRALEDVLPVGLFGSRPHCYAGQVWSQLLWTIELAYEQGTALSGITADIQKAFNFLPRIVIMESCALLGFPFEILRGWSWALASMPRRFQINGSLSAPAYSTCGLPEGCALSCVGMMVVDILFHKWMTHYFPLCQPLSYVDDWQVLVTDPLRLQPVYACLEKFTQALDLFIDSKKTHMWSVSSVGRKCIRDLGMPVVPFDRNLGLAETDPADTRTWLAKLSISADVGAVHDCEGSRILAAGALPGLLQSAVRAEIYAVLKALQLAVTHEGPVMLWSDCDAVVRRVRKLLAGHAVKPNASHSDLWYEVQQCLSARVGITQITRVAAHQTDEGQGSVFAEWCFRQ